MKKMICGVLSVALLAAFLVGCAAKPTEAEVRAAIENGTLTLEDAVEKGYVTDEWVSGYREEHTVSASDKFAANQMGAFTTTDAHGEAVTFAPSEQPVLFLFADPENSESLASIQAAEAVYEEIRSAGGDAVLVLMGETVPEVLADSPIPTIFYGDDIKDQLGSNRDMIDGNAFSAAWNMKGAFITAWYRTLDQADLPQTATDLLEAFAQPATQPDGQADTVEPAGMVG